MKRKLKNIFISSIYQNAGKTTVSSGGLQFMLYGFLPIITKAGNILGALVVTSPFTIIPPALLIYSKKLDER